MIAQTIYIITVLKDIFTSLLSIAVCVGMVWAILTISQLTALGMLRLFGNKLNLNIKNLAVANLYFIPVLILVVWAALVFAYIVGSYDLKISLPNGIITYVIEIIFVAIASIPCGIALHSIMNSPRSRDFEVSFRSSDFYLL